MQLDPTSSGLTSRLLTLALDGAIARHTAIAMNVANAGVEGYQPVVARFDEMLDQLRGGQSVTESTLASVGSAMSNQPLVPDQQATQVQLDTEMAKLAQNTVQYQALLAANGKLTSMVRMAINEGRK
jgi:flagellar basal-body rod protein FlgB